MEKLKNTSSAQTGSSFLTYQRGDSGLNVVLCGSVYSPDILVWACQGDNAGNIFSDVVFRCFYHFYAVSVMWNGLLLLFSLRSVVMNEPLPGWLIDALWCLTGRPRAAWKGTSNYKECFFLLLHFLFLFLNNVNQCVTIEKPW